MQQTLQTVLLIRQISHGVNKSCSHFVILQHDPGDNPPHIGAQLINFKMKSKNLCVFWNTLPHPYIQGDYTAKTLGQIAMWNFHVNLILDHLTICKESWPHLFCHKKHFRMLCLLVKMLRYLKIPECIHPVDLIMYNAPEALLFLTSCLFPLNIEGWSQSVTKEGFNCCLGKWYTFLTPSFSLLVIKIITN